jgi:hypothetical protein
MYRGHYLAAQDDTIDCDLTHSRAHT